MVLYSAGKTTVAWAFKAGGVDELKGGERRSLCIAWYCPGNDHKVHEVHALLGFEVEVQ